MNPREWGSSFIGYNKNHNIYFNVTSIHTDNSIMVLSKYGAVLDVFRFDSIKVGDLEYLTEAVHPVTGVVYFMLAKKDGTYFYRVENVWDTGEEPVEEEKEKVFPWE